MGVQKLLLILSGLSLYKRPLWFDVILIVLAQLKRHYTFFYMRAYCHLEFCSELTKIVPFNVPYAVMTVRHLSHH